jgi:hypothetical protein
VTFWEKSAGALPQGQPHRAPMEQVWPAPHARFSPWPMVGQVLPGPVWVLGSESSPVGARGGGWGAGWRCAWYYWFYTVRWQWGAPSATK